MELLIKANLPSPLHSVRDSLLEEKGITLFMKREDLIHPDLSGNKWRKMKYNLKEVQERNVKTLVTFGGAYSNHIRATAAAGKYFNLKTIGIIRGEEQLPLNKNLTDAILSGMTVVYVDRDAYRYKNAAEMNTWIYANFGNDVYILPEGGTNELAVRGAAEIVQEIKESYDYLCCACGTGGTLAGIIVASNNQNKILGFPALKGAAFLNDTIKSIITNYNGQSYNNWSLMLDYHCGGYAKKTDNLLSFIKDFYRKTGVELDAVYTGKMMLGIYDLIRKNYFKRGETIVAVHTGGLPNGSVI